MYLTYHPGGGTMALKLAWLLFISMMMDKVLNCSDLAPLFLKIEFITLILKRSNKTIYVKTSGPK